MKLAGGNVVLIGMPSSGKSTVGQMLAQRLGKAFVDTDLLLEQRHGRAVKDILAEHGPEGFRALEEEVMLSLRCTDSVVATGGSVVYSEPAMRHLCSLGTVVYLQVELTRLQERIGDLEQRGVVRRAGQSLASLLAERGPLYEKYADYTVPASNLSPAEVVQRIVSFLDEAQGGW